MVLESLNYIFDPVFGPLLKLGPLWTIVIISVLVSVIIVLATKFFTDQKLMKKLKEEMKDLQKELKTLQSDPQKFAAHQKKIMEKNWAYMKQSFKPTLITWLPLILILGWVSVNLAYQPLYPEELFTVELDFDEAATGQVTLDPDGLLVNEDLSQEIVNGRALWSLSGEEGIYILRFLHEGREYDKKVIVSETEYAPVIESVDSPYLNQITLGNKPTRFFGDFSLFGWKPGWLVTYIIISLIVSIIIRRLFRVH